MNIGEHRRELGGRARAWSRGTGALLEAGPAVRPCPLPAAARAVRAVLQAAAAAALPPRAQPRGLHGRAGTAALAARAARGLLLRGGGAEERGQEQLPHEGTGTLPLTARLAGGVWGWLAPLFAKTAPNLHE